MQPLKAVEFQITREVFKRLSILNFSEFAIVDTVRLKIHQQFGEGQFVIFLEQNMLILNN